MLARREGVLWLDLTHQALVILKNLRLVFLIEALKTISGPLSLP